MPDYSPAPPSFREGAPQYSPSGGLPAYSPSSPSGGSELSEESRKRKAQYSPSAPLYSSSSSPAVSVESEESLAKRKKFD